jgi:hypothetical protein
MNIPELGLGSVWMIFRQLLATNTVILMGNEEVGPGLVAISPSNPPGDIIQSALFIPISAISTEHRGRKIRTIGQYVLII